MAGTNQYTNYPVQFQGAGTWNLAQLSNCSYSDGASIDAVVPAGLHRADAYIVQSQAPTLSIETTDLTSVLTNLTNVQTGYPCSSGGEFFWQQRSSGGLFESGSAHLSLSSALGHLVPDSISVSGVGPASFNLTYHDLYDGSTAMSVPAAAAALGATTPAFVSQFYRGAVTVNGTAIDNVTDVEVGFGLSVTKEVYGGDFAPRTLAIVAVVPVIRVTCADLAEFPSKVTNSYGATFTNLIVYFRKGASGGLRGGSGTALSVTATSGHMQATDIRGAGSGNSGVTIEFKPTVNLSFSLSATHP